MRKVVNILVAEDDPDDRMLLEEAFKENRVANRMHFVQDGEELMDYLHRRGKYADAESWPDPGVILLDLNMPKKDGREALAEIKGNERFRHIPVVVLTTSKAEEDVLRSYDLGGNSFVTKPLTFEAMVGVARDLKHYWFEMVELPSANKKGSND